LVLSDPAMFRPLTIVALGVFLESAAGSCVPIDGGSIEVSWALYANGRAVTDCTCSDPPIAAVRIDVTGQMGNIDGTRPCEGRSACMFPCARQTGATPFDIPETHGNETYSIKIVAVGADGADLPGVMAPAAIVRTVVRGQPTEVEALALTTSCAAACDTMNKSGVCARP
jgi:hypothetical protein